MLEELAVPSGTKIGLETFRETAGLLQSVPGTGPITSASYIAVLGRPDRFPDSSHLVSYIGLAVSTYNSGERERHEHITNRGSGDLRMLLCEAAHYSANARHSLNPYFRRITSQHGYKKVVVAVVQRLARILFQMWRTGQGFDVNQLNVIRARQSRARRVYWQIKQVKEEVVSV